MRAAAVMAGLAAPILGGCSMNIGDIPSPIALPAGAPERPAVPYAYPAVHDMPPERAAPVMTDQQLQRMEADLVAARKRQTGGPGQKPAPKKPKARTEGAGGSQNP